MKKYLTETDFLLKEVLRDIVRRCNDKRRRNYKYYGAKGITVYDEWVNDFLVFKEWAIE